MPVAVKNNIKIIYAAVAVFLNHLNQTVDSIIEICIFVSSGFVNIFNRYVVSQFIIGEQITITVINISPGACQGTDFRCF